MSVGGLVSLLLSERPLGPFAAMSLRTNYGGTGSMFDIGWSELLIIAVVAIIIVGPKELPRMLRSLGKMLGKVRKTANEFRSQFDEAMRESELQELRSDVQNQLSDLNPMSDLSDLNPMDDIRESLDDNLDPFDDLDNNTIEGPKKKRESSKKSSKKEGGKAASSAGEEEEPAPPAKPGADLHAENKTDEIAHAGTASEKG